MSTPSCAFAQNVATATDGGGGRVDVQLESKNDSDGNNHDERADPLDDREEHNEDEAESDVQGDEFDEEAQPARQRLRLGNLAAELQHGPGRTRGAAVNQHEQRWQLAGPIRHIRVGGRTVERVGSASAAGRERDRFRRGEPSLVEPEITWWTQDLGFRDRTRGVHVDRHHSRFGGGGSADEDYAVTLGLDRGERRIGQIEAHHTSKGGTFEPTSAQLRAGRTSRNRQLFTSTNCCIG